MIQNSILILIALGSFGCASTTALVGPDGTPHHSVQCYNIHGCYSDARKACNGNYKIVNTTNEVSGGQTGGTTTIHHLLIKCEPEQK